MANAEQPPPAELPAQPDMTPQLPAQRGTPPEPTAQVEPQAEQAEPQPAAPVALPRAARRGGRLRRPLLVVAIVIASVLSIGGVVGIFVYDEATAIDRSTPAIVARQFLRAVLTDKDVNQVGLFVCQQWPAQEALTEASPDVDPSAQLSWAVSSVNQVDENNAVVAVRVTIAIGSGAVVAEQTEMWQLDATKQDGWRICAIRSA